jgi:hypothetical protein
MKIRSFEEELDCLKNEHIHGRFEYSDRKIAFKSLVTFHFGNIHEMEKHGFYIIRQKSTGGVLYIGKAGAIMQDGFFKEQDVPRRLKNVKGGDLDADKWFSSLLEEKGALVIEYVFLGKSPISPSFAEALLLQAYFNEKGCLPIRNKAF